MIDSAETQIDGLVVDEPLRFHRQSIERPDDRRPVARIPASLRRCSISARASGFSNRRAGSTISIGALRPIWPATSVASSHSSTRCPAQGCSPISRSVEASTVWRRAAEVRAPVPAAAREAGADPSRASAGPRLGRIAGLGLHLSHLHLGAGDAIIILGFVGDAHRAPRGAADVFLKCYLGGLIGNDIERPGPKLTRVASARMRDDFRIS